MRAKRIISSARRYEGTLADEYAEMASESPLGGKMLHLLTSMENVCRL